MRYLGGYFLDRIEDDFSFHGIENLMLKVTLSKDFIRNFVLKMLIHL